MSKSQIYEDFTVNFPLPEYCFDFLLNNNSCAENAEMSIKVTVSFTVDGEHIEFPIPSRLLVISDTTYSGYDRQFF